MSKADKKQVLSKKGIEPQPEDVLCGKDKHCVHAPGSIRFRTIIDSYRERYASSLTKFDKMQITKEIYETLSMTSRFLKFNTKEKAWEEISPMAARDKCGHALRFANRLKCKKNAAVMVRQKSQSNTSAAPAPGIISPTSSLSPTAVGLNAVAAAAATHSQSALGADASQLSEQKQPQQSLVQLHSQMEQQQPQASAAQRLIFSELLKRYDTMWGASHIQALAGLHTSASPSTAAAAASFLRAAAAAGTLVPAPSGTPQTLMHPLGVSADTQHSVGTDAGLGGHATVTSASPAAAPVATTAPTSAPDSINAGGSRSSPTGDHTRKATLDDLCSLLLAAKNTSS